MAVIEFVSKAKRGTTTKREKRKTGDITKAISVAAFPAEIHHLVKRISSADHNVSDIYSEAITTLRVEFDSGEKFLVQGPLMSATEGENRSIKIWLQEKADADLRYLAYKLDCFHRHVVYTAIIRWLDKYRQKNPRQFSP